MPRRNCTIPLFSLASNKALDTSVTDHTSNNHGEVRRRFSSLARAMPILAS